MQTATARHAAPGGDERFLVERHRHGDPQAFEEIHRRYQSMVYNLALRLSGQPEEAADLHQEVFLRVYRHLGSFRGTSTLKTWIYRVALNCCRSRLARRRPSAQPLAEEGAAGVKPLVDRRRDPEANAMAGDAASRLERALAQLSPAYREAVVLRDLEGLRYEEIAAVLTIRVGTVRSRIARGRERLRRLLEEVGT